METKNKVVLWWNKTPMSSYADKEQMNTNPFFMKVKEAWKTIHFLLLKSYWFPSRAMENKLTKLLAINLPNYRCWFQRIPMSLPLATTMTSQWLPVIMQCNLHYLFSGTTQYFQHTQRHWSCTCLHKLFSKPIWEMWRTSHLKAETTTKIWKRPRYTLGKEPVIAHRRME